MAKKTSKALKNTKPQKAKPQKIKSQKAKPQKTKPQKTKPQKALTKKAAPQKVKPQKPVTKKAAPKKAEPIIKNVIVNPAIIQPIPTVKVKRSGRQATPKVKKIKKVFTPFNPIQPASLNGKPVNTSKREPRGRFELEYVIRCSESLLYDFVSSPSGLSEWFSDNVNVRDGIYTFYWDGSEQKARLLALDEENFIRYQWLDKSDGSYFEFRIQTDELTGDVSLIIVDFAESEEEKMSSRLLWDAQVDKLMKMIGSHT